MEKNRFDIDEIIKVEQLPKIFSQLEVVGNYIRTNLKGINEFAETEENATILREKRTEINNTLNLMEDKRKAIKKQIEAPYEAFVAKYKVECKEELEKASKILTDKIDSITDKKIAIMKIELEEYFKQQLKVNNIPDNFIDFDSLHLKINASSSMNTLKASIKSRCATIGNDLKAMTNEEYGQEILTEYETNGYDYGLAKFVVQDKHKSIAEAKKRIDEINAKNEEDKKIEQQVDKILPPEEIKEEKEYMMFFMVKWHGTIDKGKELINYMRNNGFEVSKK